MNNILTIGNIKLINNIVLAPMAGITNLPFRQLAKSGGASLVYTEMISAKSILCNNKNVKNLLKISYDEKPISAQIFGNDAYIMSEAAKIIRDIGVDIIDINLGCPANKIIKNGSGSKLLRNEILVSKIFKYVVNSVDIPVTAKIRIGFIPGENIASKIIKIAQNCGIKMIAIHARPVLQKHSGTPDFELFSDACANAKIPIIANGGIINEKIAIDFMKIPNCSGIMIGRGAIGNYSIFKNFSDFLNGESKRIYQPSKAERIKWLREHVAHSVEYYGEKTGIITIRKIIGYYIKNLPNATKIRNMFNKIYTISEFNELLSFFELY
ncbi:MAG: tRNA dihydrouridine synthase DusB [Endomicrobium sp.]|jgi:tRNA-dihydrouridine synthase B|nr:tRNA dihydrouridine synthase DusB [Endomicrobium sp.]